MATTTVVLSSNTLTLFSKTRHTTGKLFRRRV